MHYKQIIEKFSPLNMWTFERYSGDLQNVYDEFPDNATLLNNGASLEESGQVNQNMSGKSVNVKNGNLILANGGYLSSELANRDFTISFCFKTDGTAITGVKPMVSKWSPDQQFFIGFENGDFTSKLQTTGGLLECTIDNRHVIYNNYWNQVVFHVTPTEMRLYLNGINTSATLTGAVNSSTLSQFTIGSPAPNPFTTDVWINDVAVFNGWSNYVPLILYRMTRSDKDCWLGMAPQYFYDMAFWWSVSPNKPIPNEGYGGLADCHIVSPGGNAPTITQKANYHNKQVLTLPPNSWLTIDTDIDMDWNSGWTIANYGAWDYPYANRSQTSTVYAYYKIFDLKVNAGDNVYRQVMSAEAADGSAYHSLGYLSYDSNGVLVGSSGSQVNQNYNSDTPGYGLNLHRINSTSLETSHYPVLHWQEKRRTNTTTVANVVPVPFTHNQFFYNNGNASLGSDRHEVSEWGMYEYSLDDDAADYLTYPRPMLMRNFLNSYNSPRFIWGADINSTSPAQWRDFRNGPSTNMTNVSSGVTYSYGISDPLSNKQNYFPAAAWFNNIPSSWTGQVYGEDGNDISTRDFIINFWVWNRNKTRRYEAVVNHYSSSYPRFTPSGYGPCVAINSKDKAFEEGCVEFSIKDGADADYTVYVENAVPDDGFHMITCIRRGLVTELWVDAVLRVKKVAPSKVDLGLVNRPFLCAGDECYLYEVMMDNHPTGSEGSDGGFYNQTDIEFLYQGYADVVKGQTLLSGQPIPSKLYAINHNTGAVITADATDSQGKFEFSLPKSVNNRSVDVVALPQDETATNHVVVHGPYSANTVYSRYVEEVFDSSLKDIFLDFEPERYYPMDDIVGTNVPDSSGNSNDGTIIGSNYSIGLSAMEKSSKSISLLGTDAYIDMPDGFDGLSEFTISMWVKINSTGSYARLMDCTTAASNANNDAIILYRNSTTSTIAANFTGSSTSLMKTNGINNSTWTHYIYRLKSDGTGELWVNGYLADSDNQGTSIPQNLRTDCYIGKSSYASDDLLNANVSHVAFYDYAIPTEEVKKQAYRGFTVPLETMRSRIKSDNPFAYWTFDRLKDLTDDIQDVDFVATGTHSISKNSLVLNGGVIGNNYLQTPDITVNQNNTGAWSFEVSVKTDTINTDGVVISEWNQATTDGVFKLCLDSGGFFRLYVASELSFIQSSIQYNDDKFHHVVVTYDGTTIKLYVDNSFESSVNTTLNYVVGNALTVGNTSDGDVSWFLEDETHIDDLALYDYELELQQIDNHYNKFVEKKDTL